MNNTNSGKRVIIEFAGMPKSGKSTILDVVRHELRRRDFAITDYHGGGRYAPIDKDNPRELNIYLASAAMSKVCEIMVYPASEPNHLCLLDRGIFDRIVFTRALASLGKIPAREAEGTEKMLSSPLLTNNTSIVFAFLTAPNLSMSRENKGRLADRSGRIMNESTLAALRDATLSVHKDMEDSFPKIVLVDTERFDGEVLKTANFVIDQLKSLPALANLMK